MSSKSNLVDHEIIDQVKHQLEQTQISSSQIEGAKLLLSELGRLFLGELKADTPVFCKLLGNIFQNLGSQEDAKNWYIKAVELKPDFAHALANLGTIYAMQKQWEKAIACYQKAIAILPCGGFYRNLAKVFYQQNNQAEACECWYVALMLEPNTGTAEDYLTLGRTLLELQKREQAMICLHRAVYLNPDCTQAYGKIGDTTLSQGGMEDAIAYSRTSLENPPNNLSEVHQKSGGLLGQIGEVQSAIAAHKQVESKKENPFWREYNLAKSLLEQQKFVDALEAYHNAIALDPDFAWSYYSLGDALFKLERWEEAATAYRKSSELNPDFFGSYHNLGDALFKLERWEDAGVVYRKACELNPEFFWSHYNLGQVWEKLEHWEQAVCAYRLACSLNGEFSWAYSNLGDCLIRLQRWEEAVEVYKQAIALAPKFYWSYYRLGEALIELERWEEAIAPLQEAMRLDPENSQSYYHLVKVLLKVGDDELLIDHYRPELEFKEAKVYYGLGEVLAKAGQLEEAMSCYRRALTLA